MKQRQMRAELMLLAAVAVTGMGQTLVFAILPSLGRASGLADVQVGLIISCSSLAFALASPVWGRLSEYVGRKPVLVIGMTGYTLGTLAFGLGFLLGIRGILAGVWLLAVLILSRTLQAAVMAATPAAASAYIADITSVEGRTRGMGRIGAAHNLGTIVGPVVGGLLAASSLVLPLFLVALATFAMVLFLILRLEESPWIVARESHPGAFSVSSSLRAGMAAYFDRRLLDVLVLGAGMFLLFAAVQQTLGFLFQDRFSLSPAGAAREVGIAMMLGAMMSFTAQAVVVQKLGWPASRLLRLGLPIMAAGAVLLPAGDQLMVMLAIVMLGLGLGLSMPGVTAAASLRVSAHEQGAVAGVMSACPALGFIAGPLMGTALYQWSPQLLYWGIVLLFLPLIVLAWRVPEHAA